MANRNNNNSRSSGSGGSSDVNYRLYHYTSERGAEGIATSGQINQSTGMTMTGPTNDAYYGDGVYLTSKDPYNHSKRDIAANNFDDGPKLQRQMMNQGKTDIAIGVTVPARNVEPANSSRDIWIHKGPIDLDRADPSWDKVSGRRK